MVSSSPAMPSFASPIGTVLTSWGPIVVHLAAWIDRQRQGLFHSVLIHRREITLSPSPQVPLKLFIYPLYRQQAAVLLVDPFCVCFSCGASLFYVNLPSFSMRHNYSYWIVSPRVG
ncbi:hypothetical protein ASPBRDRAFT_286076 [Aspergillus brasiliensis CBS 101740]|uniref:Uncharacterized protein n=1 Tax=Aspergillus brasiliensis (strain CBS 101740 / IMI 381727 / IBT 21946) TaxID=767769 RepID=A0A1L9UDK9_ASPBC|nr:hypothetical protein ASPBRDRAFT_286076 [Aspergillus brasiliensis CBS 101740]